MIWIVTPWSVAEVNAGMEIFSAQLNACLADSRLMTIPGVLGVRSLGPRWNPLREIDFVYRLRDKVMGGAETKPALVIANGMWGAAWGKAQTGIPLVSVQHGTFAGYAERALSVFSLEFWRTRVGFARMEQKAVDCADEVISNSALTRELVRKYYGRDSRVIENMVELDAFVPVDKNTARRSLGLPQEKKIVLFVGRRTREKGFDRLEALAREMPGILFVALTSDGGTSAVPNVRMAGPIGHAQLPVYFGACDCVFWPSRFEGFGFVPIEAIACGRPVVGMRSGVFASSKDPLGFFAVEPGPVAEWVRAVGRAIAFSFEPEADWKRRFSATRFGGEYAEVVRSYGG